ncbi:hypothetical protein [Hydrogenophaga pseudoflava]|nr:hypothetical protein [Hydrogenophaga pseudoflava]
MISYSRILMRLVLIFGAGFFSGCAAYNTEMRNSSGEVSYCQNVGWGWLGAPIAVINQHRCESAMRERGFAPVSDVSAQPARQAAALDISGGRPEQQGASKSGGQPQLRELKIPDPWSKMTIPDAKVRSGAVLWAKRQSPDVYLAVSVLSNSVEINVVDQLKLQQQAMVAKVAAPNLFPISEFEVAGIRGNFVHVVGVPSGSKEPVRFTTYVFLKGSNIYRVEISHLERDFFSNRDGVRDVVDLIVKEI